MKKDYEPYGEEWKKEIKKIPKDLIIEMLAKKGKECDKLNQDLQNNKLIR